MPVLNLTSLQMAALAELARRRAVSPQMAVDTESVAMRLMVDGVPHKGRTLRLGGTMTSLERRGFVGSRQAYFPERAVWFITETGRDYLPEEAA